MTTHINTPKTNAAQRFIQSRWGLVLGVVALAMIVVGVAIYLWPKAQTSLPVIETDAFIAGGSLAASSAAIQFSRDKTDFVMTEPFDTLGGQATLQGVSTLDQHDKVFQKSQNYLDLINAMKKGSSGKYGPYLGNALTGPGAPPKVISDYLKSRIDPKYGKVLYNWELESINYDNGRIRSVVVRQKNLVSNKYLIRAKYFLDMSDYAEMSKAAGLSYRFGLDTREETGEQMALTQQEKNAFVNGFSSNGKNIGGYGNRIQPLTQPFAVYDQGYAGVLNKAEELDIAGDTLPCPNGVDTKCRAMDKELKFKINSPSKAYDILSIVLEGVTSDSSLNFKLNGDSVKPVVRDLGGAKSFDLPIAKPGLSYDVSIANSGSKPYLRDAIWSADNISTQSILESVSSIEKKASLEVDQAKWTRSDADNAWRYSLDKNEPKLEEGKVYYLLLKPSAPTDNTGIQATFQMSHNNELISKLTFNPFTDYFPGYVPLTTIKYEKGYDLNFKIDSPKNNKQFSFDSLIFLEEDKFGSLLMLRGNDSYTFSKTGLFDIYGINGITSVKITRKSGSSTNQLSILEDKKDRATDLSFVNRVQLNAGDTIQTTSKNSTFAFRKLNPVNYSSLIVDGLDTRNQTENMLQMGNYNVFALVDNSMDTSGNASVNIQAGSTKISRQSVDMRGSGWVRLGSLNLDTRQKVSLSAQADCGGCLGGMTVYFMEQAPEKYNPDTFSRRVSNTPNQLRLIQNDTPRSQFFKYRRILDSENLYNLPQFQSEILPNTQGAGQVNTGFNDFDLDLDIKAFATDPDLRLKTVLDAKQYSAQYYYWLRYDAPSVTLGCDPDNFCSGKRLRISPELMDTSDGYSTQSYVRDPVRMIGNLTLTAKDLSWKENQCNDQSSDCTELKYSIENEQTVKVDNDFLYDFPEDAIASFYYYIDIHVLINKNISEYFNYLKSQGWRTDANQPTWLNGVFDGKVKPGTIRPDYLYNDKMNNLLFCGKNLSVSQLANGATRLHPAEMAMGQACAVMVSYLVENGLNQVGDLRGNQERTVALRHALIASGQFVLPLEDTDILKLYNQGKFDVLNAYYDSILDKTLKVKVSQDKNNQFVIFKFEASTPLNPDEIAVLAKKLGLNLNLEGANKLTLTALTQNMADTGKAERVKQALKGYHDALGDGADLSASDYALTRGDLAYIIANVK